MTLTEKQKWALYQLVSGIRDKNLPMQTLGGYAGTGKSFLLKYLTKFFPSFAVCAYTGKASSVLRKRGIPASTIHSRIYKPVFENNIVEFQLTPDPACDGFIVDEASMVSEIIFEDLKSFDLPMVFVGDHGQLEPVGSDFNIMAMPDYTLEEIHRNAGEIARFAEYIRKNYAPRGFRSKDDTVQFISDKQITDELLMNVDQVICAYNKTRVQISNRVRDILGHKKVVCVGDKVMCLRNNRNAGLFNGMQGRVVNLYEDRRKKYMDFECDGVILEKVFYDHSCFGKEEYDIRYDKNSPNPFDYAYCITAHKSQGDQFPTTLVIEQKCKKWEHKRWAYTAASRAEKKLYWKTA